MLSATTSISLLHGIVFLGVAITLWTISTVVYRLFFHPLAKFPGPRLAACSEFWFIRVWTSGRYSFSMSELHRKYGDVVRVATNELSFASPAAYSDIYNHASKDRVLFPKDEVFYTVDSSVTRPSILFAIDAQDHRSQRRSLSHAFSAKALRDNGESVQAHVKLLIEQLGQKAGPGTDGANMSEVFNWLTFDIIGDLVFGESFDALNQWKSSVWVSLILSFLRQITFLPVFNRLCIPKSLFIPLIPKDLKVGIETHNKLTAEKVQRRIEMGNSRGREDFFAHILRKEEDSLDVVHLREQAKILILAGSETTANLLTSAMFYLLKCPDKMAKFQDEIRSVFSSVDEITADSVSNLEYLDAVIEEGLRIFPPVPIGPPRVSTGATVDGVYVPKGTVVSVDPWTASHDDRNFARPYEFIPERWIGEGLGDRRDASRAFSLGPRGCLGINLAYMESRITLASLVFAYNWELLNTELDWLSEVRVFIAWEKPHLMVRFHPRGDTHKV
ncbi:related to isotrichodermin C-15 hydroxylase (cytochrome P-450 monooxygenase CYP65A1) [Fusarium torulosum]|uniref:Related to isotrichodermin C-15 hydroxylase (Cytochrome P-450 monooxygenase CYP65A1) n=1 Tax=Fusarium torulosum TaxID=33205 RepID=A0AAE8SJR5_9HYPO|nr:related to isotrichodermin C-15 hydroxylase (cytochrome P-450 monooxygenase CYP65A1) [Fusarium torulosum]